jgi:glutamate--cysteine ligase
VLSLNKKERNKMQVVKEGAHVTEVIVQEGVPTVDTVKGSPAEPMIYMVDGVPVGGMFRYNPARDAFANLNAAGMEFTGMCDESEPPECDRQAVRDCHFRAFVLVTALASLAAGREMMETKQSMKEAA